MNTESQHTNGNNATRYHWRRPWWWCVILVAALVAGFGIALLTDFQRSDRRLNSERPVQHDSPLGESAPPTEGKPNDEQRAERAVAPPPASSKAETDSEERELTVYCVKSDGSPMTAIAVTCEICGPVVTDEQGRQKLSFSEVSVHTTSNDGTFTLVGCAAYKVHLMLPKIENWHSHSEVRAYFTSTQVTIIFAPTSRLELQARFEDGRPVKGSSCSLHDRARSFEWFQITTDAGSAVFANVANDQPIEVRLHSPETGFDSFAGELSASEVQAGRAFITLKARKNRLGLIRVEFNGFKSRRDTVILLESEPWNPFARMHRPAPGKLKWETQVPPTSPRSTKYRVTVSDSSGVFASDWVEVQPGEATVVQATLAKGGEVRARILDARSKPLENAVLRPSDGSYLVWDSAAGGGVDRFRELSWTTDSNGFVTLKNLPAQAMKFEAEAEGKQPVVREIQVDTGRVADLGDIVLDDAIGEVTVELRGCKKGQKYVVLVNQPGGTRISRPQLADGSVLRKTGLAPRKYSIGVSLAEGGSTIVWGEIDLSIGSSQQTLTLDVSAITKVR